MVMTKVADIFGGDDSGNNPLVLSNGGPGHYSRTHHTIGNISGQSVWSREGSKTCRRPSDLASPSALQYNASYLNEREQVIQCQP